MMVFNLVVRRLHFLAKVPLGPQFFDAALLTWTALFHRERLGAIEQFERTLSRLNIDRCVHRFGGTGFVLNGREFAHLHGNGLLDIEFTREVASQLIVENRAVPHHVLGPSRWVSLWLKSSADIPQALALIELACEIKKADQSAGLFEPA